MTQAAPAAASSVYNEHVAAAYDQSFQGLWARYQDRRHAQLLRPYVDGRRVLDLACGTGWLLDHLQPSLYHGVDASPAMLREARRKHPTSAFSLAPAQQLDTGTGPFDTVVCLWAWPYFCSPRVARRIHDALSPGGHALIQWWTHRYTPSIQAQPWTSQNAADVTRQLKAGGLADVHHRRAWPLAHTRIAIATRLRPHQLAARGLSERYR